MVGTLFACKEGSESEEIINSSDKFAIGFNNVSTRAIINNDDALKNGNKGFSVFCKINAGQTYSAASASEYFTGESVSWNSADEAWQYTPQKYWIPNYTYRFCAYYPTTEGVTIEGDYTTTLSLKGYKVDPDYSKQGDLMISDVRECKTPELISETPSAVQLSFRHLLTNIRFSVAKSEGTTSDIVVTNVLLSNVKNTSIFTMTSTDSGNSWSVGEWTAPTGSVTYNSRAVSKEVPVATYNSTTSQWEWDTEDGIVWDGFVAIPQTINKKGVANADKVSVTVEYSSTPEGGTATVRRVTSDLPISDAGQVWQMNKRVTYRLMINEDNVIKFGKPSVESWGTAQASGTIIIK